jgi:hypothetical protein
MSGAFLISISILHSCHAACFNRPVVVVIAFKFTVEYVPFLYAAKEQVQRILSGSEYQTPYGSEQATTQVN